MQFLKDCSGKKNNTYTLIYRMNALLRYTATGLLLTLTCVSSAQKVDFNLDNLVSSWGTVNFREPIEYQAGGRYIPSLSISDSLRKKRRLDAEMSFNAYGNLLFTGSEYESADGKIKPYRLWLRYTAPRFELRAGLQKINFGSASVLRPLMWFDRMDYRDPLQLTDGVYGLLGRYYFQKNTNIWLWVLYGNDKPKGWESVPTEKNSPELGGRIQLPVPKGEIGISSHFRKADYSALLDTLPMITQTAFREERIGVDGKLDLGIGAWFEYVVYHNDPNIPFINEWETYFNVGIDYTFMVGNGLNIVTEYFRYNSKADAGGQSLNSDYSVLALNYPVGLLNSITAAVYYNWDTREWSRFINVQRQYDFWSFYLMAFWNPEYTPFTSLNNERNMFAGKGIQVMASVNF
jgi:hypothetical protein